MRYLIVLGALCLLLAGCGGGGGSSGPPVFNFPQFNKHRTGTWKGRETNSVTQQSGEMTLFIKSDFKVTGFWRTDSGVVWTITGLVQNDQITVPPDNTVTVHFASSGEPDLDGSGTLLVQLTDHLGGTLTLFRGSNLTPVVMKFDIDLIRQ